MKPKVLIVVRGGLVQEVTASEDMDIYIVDHDNIKADTEYDRLTAIAAARTPENAHTVRTDVEAAVDEELSDYCRQCGDNADDGEGYDGLCGNCADQKDGAK